MLVNSGISERTELREYSSCPLKIDDIREEIDFALAFAVLHEFPDVSTLFREVYNSLRMNGKMLVAEPKGHVDEGHFQATLSTAAVNGFTILSKPDIAKSLTALIEKK